MSALSTLGASSVVALAYWLGAGWLSEKALGLPAGVWVVILLSAWAARGQARQAATRGRGVRPAMTGEASGGWSRAAWGLRRGLAVALDRSLGLVAWTDAMLGRTAVGGLGLDRRWRRRLTRRAERLRLSSSPLRVGFAMARRRAEQLIDQDPGAAEWYVLDRGLDPADAAVVHGLDAVVVELAPGVIRIQTLEREGADASWFDWAKRRPLSYESVFPLRIDPAGMHLDLSEEGELASSADITAELVKCAAVLGRHPERLDVQDHVLGRRPTAAGSWALIERADGRADGASDAMARLAAMVEQRGRCGRTTEADRAAARAVSAWLASWDESVTDEQRRRWIEGCARVLPDEPEVMLRLAAVRLSAMDDEMGIAALRDADAALQREQPLCVSDPVAFLQAELEHGPENPMTVARVASGLCLALAGVPTKRLAFLQEDLLDDMRFATWLVGRDQDRALLMRVMRELREARERREAMDAGELRAA